MCRRTPHKIQHRHEIAIIARGVALDDKHSRNIKDALPAINLFALYVFRHCRDDAYDSHEKRDAATDLIPFNDQKRTKQDH